MHISVCPVNFLHSTDSCITPSLFYQSFHFTRLAPFQSPAKLELRETDENQVKNGGSSLFPFTMSPSIFLLTLLLLPPIFPPLCYIFSAYIPLWPQTIRSIHNEDLKTLFLLSHSLTRSLNPFQFETGRDRR